MAEFGLGRTTVIQDSTTVEITASAIVRSATRSRSSIHISRAVETLSSALIPASTPLLYCASTWQGTFARASGSSPSLSL